MIGSGVWIGLSGSRRAAAAGIAAGSLMWQPLATVLLVLAGGLMLKARRTRDIRVAREAATAEMSNLGRLMGLALRSGSSPAVALSQAAVHLETGLAGEVHSIIRRAQLVGLGAALSQPDPESTGADLYRMIGRAVLTGGPLDEAMATVTGELERDQMAARLARARRLPVRLMLPLALLILPGFVLMTLAPVLDEALRQFGF